MSAFDRFSFSMALGMIGTDLYKSILNGEHHGAFQHFGNGWHFTVFIENVRITFADMVSNLMDIDCHAFSRESFKAMVCLSSKPINQQSPFMTVMA